MNPTLDDLTSPLDGSENDWNDEGVIVLRNLIDDDLIEAYERRWMEDHGWRGAHVMGFPHGLRYGPENVDTGAWLCDARSPHGYEYCTPYMDVPELREICTDAELSDALTSAVGEPCGVHLNLTGWVSTERDWHQDGYLNPPFVGDRYAAAWISLGDVDDASGPFEYVPGSHRWHRLDRAKVLRELRLKVDDPQWPWKTEKVLGPLVEGEIAARGAEVVRHLPGRGDVLLWHPRLYHRGSKARVPEAWRPALIAHYSGVGSRPDMPQARRSGGGWLFPIEGRLPVR